MTYDEKDAPAFYVGDTVTYDVLQRGEPLLGTITSKLDNPPYDYVVEFDRADGTTTEGLAFASELTLIGCGPNCPDCGENTDEDFFTDEDRLSDDEVDDLLAQDFNPLAIDFLTDAEADKLYDELIAESREERTYDKKFDTPYGTTYSDLDVVQTAIYIFEALAATGAKVELAYNETDGIAIMASL